MKLFWVTVPEMKKFHAFTISSGTSICRKWFVGFAKGDGTDWDKSDGENSKCKLCIIHSFSNVQQEES